MSHVICPCRWSEVSRRIELWVSIQELNEQGDYSDVEMHPGKDIGTGGVFQLRQVTGQEITMKHSTMTTR